MHDLTFGSTARAAARAASARKSLARFTPRQPSPPMCSKRRRLNTGFQELLGFACMDSFLGYATALQGGPGMRNRKAGGIVSEILTATALQHTQNASGIQQEFARRPRQVC